MLNGTPNGYVKSTRGIRQGLFPYLFVEVMEFWSLTMDIAIAKGDIRPMRRNEGMIVSHLLFVDDMLVYCKGDTLSALGVNEALHRFVYQ